MGASDREPRDRPTPAVEVRNPARRRGASEDRSPLPCQGDALLECKIATGAVADRREGCLRVDQVRVCARADPTGRPLSGPGTTATRRSSRLRPDQAGDKEARSGGERDQGRRQSAARASCRTQERTSMHSTCAREPPRSQHSSTWYQQRRNHPERQVSKWTQMRPYERL